MKVVETIFEIFYSLVAVIAELIGEAVANIVAFILAVCLIFYPGHFLGMAILLLMRKLHISHWGIYDWRIYDFIEEHSYLLGLYAFLGYVVVHTIILYIK